MVVAHNFTIFSKCMLEQMAFMWGCTLEPFLYKLVGICPRDNWSAILFSAVEIYRVEIFSIFVYLMRSIAATTAQTKGLGARRLDSHATTFVLSEYKVSKRLVIVRANECTATHAARSSSQAMSIVGNDSHPSQVTNHGLNCSMDNAKYAKPQYPPIPPDNDASAKIGVLVRGSVPKINEKCNPLFRDSKTRQTLRHITIISVIGRSK